MGLHKIFFERNWKKSLVSSQFRFKQKAKLEIKKRNRHLKHSIRKLLVKKQKPDSKSIRRNRK